MNSTSLQLQSLLEQERLPADYLGQVNQWLRPLSAWLTEQSQARPVPLLVGLNGAQGTGKTTTARFLEILLGEAGLRCCTLALDDYYLGCAIRLALARDVHPLLRTRGVPGTHDVEELQRVLDRLESGEEVSLRRFSKAEDDVLAPELWPLHRGANQVIILEGWCVGCPPQGEAALAVPCNSLERVDDPDRVWRDYVNNQLSTCYAAVFERLDLLVMLQAPDMETIVQWRLLQEKKLAQHSAGAAVMAPADVPKFVAFYERLTRHSLSELPALADYWLRLDHNHRFVEGGPG
jgi:D-glycerate 3-kinase